MHTSIDTSRVLRGRGTGDREAAPGAAVRKEPTVRSVSNSWRQATRTKGRRTRSLRSAIQESNWMPSELTSESTEWESKVRPKIPGPPGPLVNDPVNFLIFCNEGRVGMREQI